MSQQLQSQGSQQPYGALEQSLPQSVTEAVYDLEQLESDAQFAHARAMKMGDSQVAHKLGDVAEIAQLQKTLLLRESDLAQTTSQCVQQALQQCTQQLQTSQVPGVQEVVQGIQQVSQSMLQASARAAQSSSQLAGQSQMASGQSKTGASYQGAGSSQTF